MLVSPCVHPFHWSTITIPLFLNQHLRICGGKPHFQAKPCYKISWPFWMVWNEPYSLTPKKKVNFHDHSRCSYLKPAPLTVQRHIGSLAPEIATPRPACWTPMASLPVQAMLWLQARRSWPDHFRVCHSWVATGGIASSIGNTLQSWNTKNHFWEIWVKMTNIEKK